MNLQELAANAISRELTAEQIKALTEQEFADLAVAYALAEVKKFEQFATIYQSNPEARKAFQENIYNQLGGE